MRGFKKNNKGQAEIFGIAIVVVMIIFILLFVLRFKSSETLSTTKTDVTYTKLAWNFINTITKTNTGCEGISIGDLLIDCAKPTNLRYINCNGVSSCKYANDTISDILKNTLGKRNDKYVFSATKGNTKLFDDIRTTGTDLCNASDYANVPISTGREIIEISIKICR